MPAVSERSKWNVATFLVTVVLLLFLGTASWALVAGKVTFTEWAAAVGPVLGGLMGWVARMLGGGGE